MRRDITEKPQRDDRDTASLLDRPKRQYEHWQAPILCRRSHIWIMRCM